MAAADPRDPRVQEILQEAADDEAGEVHGQPSILEVGLGEAALEEVPEEEVDAADAALEDDPQGAIHVAIPRRLRRKTQPPPAWQEYAPFEPPGARKRPARKNKPNELCPGRGPGQPCLFSQHKDRLGKAARLDHGQRRCRFCDPEALAGSFGNPQKKKFITRALRTWKEAGQQEVFEAAMVLVSADRRTGVAKALARPSRAAGAAAARAEAQALDRTAALAEALAHRVFLGPAPEDDEAQRYQRKVADDGRRLRGKFGPMVAAQEEADETWRSDLARRFEVWCKEGSWAACQKCHRLEKRPLREMHLTGKRQPSHTVKECSHCKDGIGYATVAAADIPEPLRRLSPNVSWALRPLEPDVGKPAWARHAYRVHTDMTRFWWRPGPVESQIQQLEDPEEQDAAITAFEYLMSSEDSSYRKFVEMHKKFLRKHADVLSGAADDRKLQLPRRALEEEGLECAVWPHLYLRTNMCETHIRLADVRRQARAEAKRPGSALERARASSASGSASSQSCHEDDAMDVDAATDPEEEEEDLAEAAAPLDFAKAGRNSAKSAYLAKVLGPVLGYGATYELFQFVYDLWLWSTLGAKKHTVEAPLRLAMAGYSFSPEYWHTRHAALVDMVKQLGLPTLFLTVALYEWSFPFHAWVEDEAAKLLRARLKLPVAETLHIAHVLAQTVQGLLTGANRKEAHGTSKAWKSHLFSAKDGSGRRTVLNFFGRLEYQDGKRKRYINQEEVATQFYHGRGTVHLHLLVWLQHVEAVKLEDSLSAAVPAENEVMACLVEGSQRSWTGSGWPKEPKGSYYDAATGLLHLHHSEEDYCKYKADGTPEGVRAYIPDILASLKCHVDVQMSDGRGMLLKYVSGYVPKFSDSFTTEWLQDGGSDYAVAKRVLTDYHPLEPEMTLQLAMQWFPQCFAGGTLQRFRVPVPWEGICPDRVQQYMDSKWRRPDMTLAEFLRKTNQQGQIHRSLKKRYLQAKMEAETGGAELMEESLEEWANNAQALGEVALAAMYLSRYNDKFYGQWALMNVPFQRIDDLKKPGLELVPDHLYYQALVYLLRPEHWTDPAAIRQELELEAFREYHIKNITAMLSANQGLITKYLDGTLDKQNDGLEAHGTEAGAAPAEDAFALSRQQQQIVDEICECVQEGMKQRQKQEDAWKGEDPADMEADAEQNNPFVSPAALRPAFAVLGPAGSGKTTAVHKAIAEVTAHGGRVLLAAPTGRLAATMREKFPHLEVDTVHGAFLVYKPVHETLELMWPYDLVIVEEVGQLSQETFERIMQQWQAAEKIPTLVFVGDFFQLPGVDPTCALDSGMWHNVMVKKRTLHTMQRCKCPKLRKTLEILRTNKPSVEQLREIKSGHKAPSLHRAGYIMNEEPSLDDVGHILAETPNTLFLTVSRRAAAHLNGMALAVLFAEAAPLAMLPADPESNVNNYADGHRVTDIPLEICIYLGARVILTKNLNKAIGFVNGMGAVIVGLDRGNVLVRTDQGILLAVHPWTSEEHVVHYPLRLGYASTLHKVQGATLPHATVWLDVPNMPAAAYVALSRVQYDANWRFVGNPGIHHFTPARFHWGNTSLPCFRAPTAARDLYRVFCFK